MYEVFNRFLERETWRNDHPNDNTVFYQALSEVISKNDFSPDTMSEYFREILNISNDGYSYDWKAVERRCQQAWAIKEYLAALRLPNS